jgi:hypothetical protein
MRYQKTPRAPQTAARPRTGLSVVLGHQISGRFAFCYCFLAGAVFPLGVADLQAATPSGRTIKCQALTLIHQLVPRRLIGWPLVLVGCARVRVVSAAP